MKTLTLYTTVSLILFLFIIPSSQPVVAYEADGRRAINLEQSLVRSAELRIDQRLNRGGVRAVQHRNDEIIVKFTGSKQHTRVRTGGRDVEVVLAEYRNRADIEYAEPNYIAYAFGVPNDPYYQYQWNFDNDTYGGVQAEAAWGVTSGAGVTVAVLDTGIAYEDYNQSAQNRYYQAPDLADTNFVGGYDFVDNDTHANDTNGHGTHVAGTIAGATNNSLGVAGLASGATIMPVKVLGHNGAGSYADITDGIIFAADNGADVINLSLGGSASASYLEDALRYAYDKGVTIVAAAGNDGSEIVSYPAAYDAYVIAVGATRFDETLASYSNYGTALDIVAPGGDTSVDQNGDGYVDGILQQTFGTRTNSFSYYFYQGTSMATPHVAAAAALVIASGNAAVPSEVRSVLESTADDLGSTGRDNQYGHGLLNLAAALSVGVSPPEPEPEPEPDPEPVNDPPTVALTSPVDGAVVKEIVTIVSDPQDDTELVSVEFFIDGVLHDTVTVAPFTSAWDTTAVNDGSYTLAVVATDDIGQIASASVLVTVDNVVSPSASEIEVFADSFENGLTTWVQDDQADWRVRTQRATAGSYSAEVDGRADNAALMSPVISLAGKKNARISFSWLIERRVDRDEYVAVDVSTDDGTTWIEYRRLRGNVDAEDVWHAEQIEISDVMAVQLRFRGTMSRSSEDANVDEVVVVGY